MSSKIPSQQPFNVPPQYSKKRRAWWQEGRRPGQSKKPAEIRRG